MRTSRTTVGRLAAGIAAALALAACGDGGSGARPVEAGPRAASEPEGDGAKVAEDRTAAETVDVAATTTGVDAPTAASSASGTGHMRTLEGAAPLTGLRLDGRTTTPPVESPELFVHTLVPVDGEFEHDFGPVLEGEPLEYEFVLENTGDEPVVVDKATTTCKCTVSNLSVIDEEGGHHVYELGTPLPPGARLGVRAGLKTVLQRGHMRHQVTLLHSGGVGATKLGLGADVHPFFTTQPDRGSIPLGKLRRGQSATGHLDVQVVDGRHVMLSIDPEQVASFVHPTLEPVDPDENGRSAKWHLVVTVGPDIPETVDRPWGFELRSDVPLPAFDAAEHSLAEVVDDTSEDDVQRTSSAEPSTYVQRVILAVTVVPPVLATPNHIAFGVFKPGTSVSKSIDVEFTDDRRVTEEPKLTVEWGLSKGDTAKLDEHLHASFVETDDGREWRLTFDLDGLPAELAGPFQGRVLFETGHPSRPVVEVPFSGLCAVPGGS
ncbi:MAG: DUF1573 domain-containing protein [Planctomycetota bacterium]